MKTLEYNPDRADFYKGKDYPTIEGSSTVDGSVAQPHRPEVKGKAPEEDPGAQEREQQLEAWMTDVKAFIRNIDISKL